jgi:aerobic carbon-monoxide dehydrogenase large subunit
MSQPETPPEPVGRVEDRRLVTGRGRYVDDLKLEGQVYMGMVRSPYAHARIVSVDFSEASSSPDFIASLTGEDLLSEGVRPVTQNPWPSQKSVKRYHLAVGKVRFVGEPVAAILVRTKNSVEDLVELVRVEYETLPAVTTIEQSKKGATLVYEELGDNISQTTEVEKGDAETAIASAAHVIRTKEGIARQVAAPIEPHAVLAAYDGKKGEYEVWATVQTAHGSRDKLSKELGIPKDKIHVRVMDVGGGFGSKGAQSYPEAPLACVFSKMTGLPVKWTATRSEEFLQAAAGRDEYCDVTLACDERGRIVAVRARVECDSGVTGTQAHMPSITLESMLGPYAIPNRDLKVAAYITNKMPLGPVRGAGVPEGTYFIERAVDALAKEMGLDPIEFRRRNVPGGTPSAHGDAKGENYTLLLDALVESSKYQELLRWRDEMASKFREQGASHSSLIGGLGISLTGSDDSEEEEQEDWSNSGAAGGGTGSWQAGGASSGAGGGGWPAQQAGAGGAEGRAAESGGAGSWQNVGGASGQTSWPGTKEETLGFMSETARVTLSKTGEVTVYTGSSPHGQGEETTFAQLASEELGFPLETVRVIWGDTALIPRGVGTFGSRSATTGGSAVVDATRKLKSQLLAKASEIFPAKADQIKIRDGVFIDGSSPGVILGTFSELLEKLHLDEISSSSVFTLSESSYSSGVQLCAVTLDVEFGKVKIVKYVVVEDCGTMTNKMIVEGQLHGGIVHGIGGALFEKLAYDSDGNLLTTTFMDYNIPEAPGSPDVEVFHRVTPSTATLDGVKGVGESGTNAAYAAVMNALNDALSQVGPNLELNMAPATPDSIFSVLSRNAGAPKVAQ